MFCSKDHYLFGSTTQRCSAMTTKLWAQGQHGASPQACGMRSSLVSIPAPYSRGRTTAPAS